MRFIDEYFSSEERYSLGTDSQTGNKYISIPVSNGLVDYEEYYRVDESTYEELKNNPPRAIALANLCRKRQNDPNLIVKPGSNRGVG